MALLAEQSFEYHCNLQQFIKIKVDLYHFFLILLIPSYYKAKALPILIQVLMPMDMGMWQVSSFIYFYISTQTCTKHFKCYSQCLDRVFLATTKSNILIAYQQASLQSGICYKRLLILPIQLSLVLAPIPILILVLS